MDQGNQPQRRNLAAEAFRRNYAALHSALAQPDVASGLATKLYCRAIISLETRDAIQASCFTPTQQANWLLRAVESSIKIDHTRLRKLTLLLRKKPFLEPIAKQLHQCYRKLVSEASLMESSSSGSDTDSTELHQFRGQGTPKNTGAENDHSGSSSAVIPEVSVLDPCKQETEDTGKEITRTERRIDYLEGQYMALVEKTQKEVVKKNPDLMSFRTRITLLPTSFEEEHIKQYIRNNLPQLYRAESIPEIFGLLNLYWNYLQYGLLKHIIDIYGTDDTKKIMTKFIKDVELFKQETTLAMYWEAHPKRRSQKSLGGDIIEVLTSHVNLTSSSSLKSIEDIRLQFADTMSLPEFAVVIKEILPGSVIIVWLMPTIAGTMLTEQVKEGRIEFFEQQHILELRMNDVMVYSSRHTYRHISPELDEMTTTGFPSSKKTHMCASTMPSLPNLQAVLDNHMTSILEMINLQALMPYLHRHHLLTKHQTDMLLNSTLTEYHRKQELISILLSKGDEGCRRFLDAVSEEPEHLGHSEIAAMLTDPGNTAVVPNTGINTAVLKAALDNHMPSILEKIDLQALVPYLTSRGLLTMDEQYILLDSTCSEHHRKQLLVSIIPSKGSEGYRRFLEAVSEEPKHLGHREIVAMLTDTGNTSVVPNTGLYTADLRVALENHMPSILEKINLQALIPYLISHGLLTEHERQLLWNIYLPEHHRKQELISIILSKGPEGSRLFLEAVSKEPAHLGHRYIVAILTDEGSTPIPDLK